MLQWQDIDTVLLDMDGTLLDLHFDNHFWLEHLPKRYSQIHNLSEESVRENLKRQYAKLQGQLKWYCFDYWAKELNLDIVELKREVSHLIQIRQSTPEFLTALRKAGKQVILLTNSHPDGMTLKFEKTQLHDYFDRLISTHEYGYSKESLELWQAVQADLKFDKARTLFVDDSLPILHKAQEFGIQHLVAIKNPDSQQASREIKEFEAIEDYWQMIKALEELG
ncbi:GMP/IMP nucleotidase [Catenovulum maritimum]|uniref:HAD family hydrolase n=1 Tax=Catenovulum maritimum TaxID=1513271 RepID=A0A0J8GND0_9ALTE|nr:GMP/IMP nucleotidase [Catenovulum maritimum]KMT64322.1 hypothetical protein XM47_15120 [Catenovulum maritimum]